jgi:hypothetical protein
MTHANTIPEIIIVLTYHCSMYVLALVRGELPCTITTALRRVPSDSSQNNVGADSPIDEPSAVRRHDGAALPGSALLRRCFTAQKNAFRAYERI